MRRRNERQEAALSSGDPLVTFTGDKNSKTQYTVDYVFIQVNKHQPDYAGRS